MDNLDTLVLMWTKLDPLAKIPTKTQANAGYDIYTIEDNVLIPPHEGHMFRTGIAAVIPANYGLLGRDRGSTGSLGIHLHCGVVDSNYRGEIFVCLWNDTNHAVFFSSNYRNVKKSGEELVGESKLTIDEETKDIIIYPFSKAIAQLVLIPIPNIPAKEIDAATFAQYKDTDRGEGKLGSSGK